MPNLDLVWIGWTLELDTHKSGRRGSRRRGSARNKKGRRG